MAKSKNDKSKRPKRDFIGVIYKCCNVYNRIYIDNDKSSFLGFCPKCGAKMEVLISPTGSKSKFFTAK